MYHVRSSAVAHRNPRALVSSSTGCRSCSLWKKACYIPYTSRRQFITNASGADSEASSTSDAVEVQAGEKKTKKKAPGVNLYDPAATASRFLTRRFGIVGGLGFVAILASTEGFEIVKALLEHDDEGDMQLVELPSGLSYRDIKVGGGASPKTGDFVGAHLLVKDGDTVLLDTKAAGRPIAFTLGRRPYSSVVCTGLEEGVTTMKRGGVRELTVPPQLAFGDDGKELAPGKQILPGATLTYLVTLEDVSPSYL